MKLQKKNPLSSVQKNLKAYARMAACLVLVPSLTACMGTEKEGPVTTAKLETQSSYFEPITRLAFVETTADKGRIDIVRSDATKQISDIETAAGSVNNDSEVNSH